MAAAIVIDAWAWRQGKIHTIVHYCFTVSHNDSHLSNLTQEVSQVQYIDSGPGPRSFHNLKGFTTRLSEATKTRLTILRLSVVVSGDCDSILDILRDSEAKNKKELITTNMTVTALCLSVLTVLSSPAILRRML